jgi:hypothetical protein
MAGQALYQYAPTKIARIFRLAFFPPQSPGKTPTAHPGAGEFLFVKLTTTLTKKM